MRIIAFAAAAFIVSGPAARAELGRAQLSRVRFSVVFPANPKIETASYEVADGRSVPAHVYSARQDKGQFKITVAALAKTGLDEKAVIDHAVKTLSHGAIIKVNVPARIYKVYGRQLPIEGADRSRSMVAMFDVIGRLYQIQAKGLPGGNEFELTRFQQSLVFERGITNRSPEEVRAIGEAYPGLAGVLNAVGNPVQPAGPDDPRCQTRR